MNWSPFDYKTNKKEWKKEAETCLDYALNKIQNEYRNVRINKIIKAKILNDYYIYCAIFDNSYVKGNMDSFEKAACLMTAIHKNKILFYGDNQVSDIGVIMFSRKTIDDLNYKNGLELRAELALDAALKMCENPICYVGEKWNEPKQLEHFNLEQFTTDYEDEWKKIKYELFITGYYSEGKYSETLSKYLMLKYLYQYVNSRINEETDEMTISTTQESAELTELAEGLKKTRKELVELCESNPEQAKELAIEALIRTGVIKSKDDVVKGKAYTKERKIHMERHEL